MILSFNIEYRTNWGEEVRISGLFPESIPLHTTDGIYWTAELELEVPQEGMTINYSYQIEQNGIVIRREWDSFPRSIFLSGTSYLWLPFHPEYTSSMHVLHRFSKC